MKTDSYHLKEADGVEVVILVDNFSDVLLPGSGAVVRPPLARGGVIPKNTPQAEHGLCLLVKVRMGDRVSAVLLDAGYTDIAVPHNLDFLGISLEKLDAVILSHGHMDHVGALKEIFRRTGRQTRLIVHPDAFLDRALQFPAMDRIFFPPFPDKATLTAWGAEIVENKDPLLLCEGSMLITGEVPRVTGFEKGMPGAMIFRDGGFVPDTFRDDQSIVVNVKNKGLVVISGCAHAGIINSVLYGRELTGRTDVCAVIGGFHLSGAIMEPAIEPTVKELKKMSLQVISPMHCTGFKAIARIAGEMPDAFVLSSVGTRILL